MLQTAKPLSFDKLDFYTPNEVSLWNAGCRLLPSPSLWGLPWRSSADYWKTRSHKLTLLQTQYRGGFRAREHSFDSASRLHLAGT
jgi:hypothetical protein